LEPSGLASLVAIGLNSKPAVLKALGGSLAVNYSNIEDKTE
jgi:hypothetical protein